MKNCKSTGSPLYINFIIANLLKRGNNINLITPHVENIRLSFILLRCGYFGIAAIILLVFNPKGKHSVETTYQSEKTLG